MAGTTVTYVPSKTLKNLLKNLDATERTSVQRRFLASVGRATEANAVEHQIIRGRGMTAPVLAKQLTRRTGRLSDSISTDESKLPRSVQVGTPVKYGSVHERGYRGTVTVGTHRRTVAFGRRIPGGFVVPVHRRKVNIRKRPFLKPAAQLVLKHETFGIMTRELARARR